MSQTSGNRGDLTSLATVHLKKKATSRNLVFSSIKQSWADIPAEMVRKLFKTCRISHTLDITEKEVYAVDMPELAEEDEFKANSEEDDDNKKPEGTKTKGLFFRSHHLTKVHDQQQ